MIWFFLLSGLLLGWSLGSNDAANIFGTAVGSRMVSFRVAALAASAGVIAGAVLGGAGTTGTLGSLGAVDAMAGSFTVALAAGVTVAWMNRAGLPVSASQAVVGGIVGWNLFTSSPTDMAVLGRIVAAWVISPILAGLLAIVLYYIARALLRRNRFHMLVIDSWTRSALIIVGAFGAYSLGANNIGNVVGAFVPADPFPALQFGALEVSGTRQLFLLGALAIALGIWTNSRRTMMTVGSHLYRLTPITALIVVLSHSLVLFLFASTGLQALLLRLGLPTVPLVPVSSTQAVIGAIMGLALVKGGGVGIRFSLLGRIAAGWVATPVGAGVLCFVGLFFVQNVFGLDVVAGRSVHEARGSGTQAIEQMAQQAVMLGYPLDGAAPQHPPAADTQ